MKTLSLLSAILLCVITTCKSQENYVSPDSKLGIDSVYANDSLVIDSVCELISHSAQYSERGSKIMIVGAATLALGAIIAAPAIIVGGGIAIIIGEIYHIVGVRKLYDASVMVRTKNQLQ